MKTKPSAARRSWTIDPLNICGIILVCAGPTTWLARWVEDVLEGSA